MLPEEDEPEAMSEAEFEEEDLGKWVDEFGRGPPWEVVLARHL